GFLNVRASCSDQCGGFSCEASLTPSRSRRVSICSSSRPACVVSSDASSAASSVHAVPATIGRALMARALPPAEFALDWRGDPNITRFHGVDRREHGTGGGPWAYIGTDRGIVFAIIPDRGDIRSRRGRLGRRP